MLLLGDSRTNRIMLKVICFLVLFVQAMGIVDERSKRISACVVKYMISIKYNGRTCDGFEVYVKCILKEAIDDTYTMTSDHIEIYKAKMEEAMLRQGLICDFDIKEMIEELEDEQEMNLNHNHKPPLSGIADEDSTGMDACINNIMASVINEKLTCDVYKGYMMCMLKALTVDVSMLRSEDMEDLKARMEEIMLRRGLNCDLDIEEMIEELQDDQTMSLNQNHKSPLTRLADEGSTGVDVCVNNYVASLINEKLTCDVYEGYLMCMLKALTVDVSMLRSEDMENLQAYMEEIMLRFGLNCDLDIEEMIEELQDDQKMSLNQNHKSPLTRIADEDSTGMDACIKNFVASVINEKLTCDVYEGFLMCMLKALTVDVSMLRSEDMEDLKARMEEIMLRFGLNCDLDIEEMIEELQDDQKMSLNQNHKSPLTRIADEDSTGMDACIKNFVASVINEKLTCDVYEGFLMCMLKALTVDVSMLRSEDMEDLKARMEEIMLRFGLNCDLDIEEMIEELQDDQKMSLNQNHKSPLTRIADEDSTGMDVCVNNFVASVINEKLTCDVYEGFLMCTLKALTVDVSMLRSEDMEDLQAHMEEIMLKFGLNCDLDIEEMIEELQDDQKMSLNQNHKSPLTTSDVPDGMGACLDNLMTSFLNEQPECDATEVYVKCLLKVLGADPFTMTQHNMKNLETGIKKEQSKYKLNCDLDITKIIEVLKYDKEMNLNQNHKPPHTDYRKATGIGECMDIMARRNANVDEGYCQLYDPLVTCVVRVINNNKIDMDKVNEHYRIIYNIFLEQLFAMGSECNIEIPTLFTNADYKENDNS